METARWAAEPITLGPGSTITPHVIGPEAVPWIVDPAEARENVELAPEIGADDPFWMLLVAPHREPTRVELDVDDYDVAEFCLAGSPPPERCAVV